MDNGEARSILDAERARLEQLLTQARARGQQDRDLAQQTGDSADLAQPLATEGVDDAITAGLLERLDSVARAEERLRAGRFGLSVRSGQPIPDERLRAYPDAELTVEEANSTT